MGHRETPTSDGREARVAGEDYVKCLADKLFQGDTEKAGARMLKDFRTGNLGHVALERPPLSINQ
jgi:hypothetical protein